MRALLVVLVVLWPQALLAQAATTNVDGVKVGDRWVYDSRDEVTGFPKDTYTYIVTEVSKDQIVTSLSVRGKPNHPLVTFGHDWALIDNGVWKFKPSNGQTIPPQLTVGKEWRSEYEAKNLQSGANRKGSALSKVLAQEKITTSAGTFDTFKIDWQAREFNPADPARSSELEVVTWFAPQINRWVRQTAVVKSDKRTRSSTSEELADFSRDF